MLGTTPAGWYPDPQQQAPLRWWDGVWWTAWESDGARQWFGAPPHPARILEAKDLPVLGVIRTVFLVEAQRRGVLPSRQAETLARLADQLAAEVLGAPAAAPRPATPLGPGVLPTVPDRLPTVPDRPPTVPAPGPLPSRALPPRPTTPAPRPPGPRPPRPPGRLAQWWAASRLRLDTDLTVHGLTYLGVLLLFVGVFGLVAFAFGDVAPALRPVAEVAVAAVPFVAAALLARSGARFVARAMVAVGGLILPVMVVTSTVDGFGFPPDLHGFALPLGAGLACAVVAAGYALRVARSPESALRVMWAPVVWFATAIAALGLGRPVPRGEDVAVPGAAQVAVLALALLATSLVAARMLRRAPAQAPGAALATGALAAVPAGLVVTAVLALVAWAAEAWPLIPAIVTTAALALVGSVVRPRRADALLTAGWLVVLLRVATVDDTTPLLSADLTSEGVALAVRPALVLAGLLAGLGLLEWLGRRSSTDVAAGVPLPTAGGPPSGVVHGVVGWAVTALVVVGVLAWPGVWWGIAGAAVAAVWAALRRVRPPWLAGSALPLDVLAGVAPLAVIGGVWQEAGGAVAGILAAGVAAGATPLARGHLRRAPEDLFWPAWWSGLLGAVLLGSIALSADGLPVADTAPDRVVVPVMLLLVTFALATGPGSRAVRIALVTPVLWGLWAAVAAVTGLDVAALALGYVALGLGAVVAAHLLPSARPDSPTTPSDAAAAPEASVAPWRMTAAGTVAVAGYLTGVFAALMALGAERPAWPFAVALAGVTLAWLLTAVAGDRGRSPVVTLLDPVGGGPLAWVLTVLGLPGSALAALAATERVLPAWQVTPVLVAALGFAAATRVRTPPRLRPVLPWAGFGLAVLAAGPTVLGFPEQWSAVVALAVLALVPPLVRPRHPAMVWTAWAAVAPLVGLAAWNASADARDLGPAAVVAGVLVGVGGMLAVGALVADRAHPREPRAVPVRPGSLPPFLLGAGELVVGTLMAAALPDQAVAGTLLLVSAGLLLGAAGLTGIGSVGATAVLVAWVGVRLLVGTAYVGAWADLALAAALLAVALTASLLRTPDARWARWDVPLAVAATPPAVAALAVATTAEQPPVHVLTGVLAIATAVRLGHVPRLRVSSETLAWTGSVLVVLGAAWAGRGWVVGALVAQAAGHTALAAVRESGPWRTARQWIGAALAAAAWLVVLDATWLGTSQTEADVTAVGGALVAVAVLAVAATGRLHRSWATAWGSVATALALLACVLPLLTEDRAVAGTAQLTANGGAVVGWWQVGAWALLAVAAELAGRAYASRAGWRLLAVGPLLAALLSGLAVAHTSTLLRVTVLSLMSMAAAIAVLVLRRRRPTPSAAEPPLVTFGVATLLVAAGFALAGRVAGPVDVVEVRGAVLGAAVLAVAAVEAAAYGVALRLLGLRAASPVLAWLAWALYAADAIGGTAAWYTIPVGLAMLAVVEVWRADRRRRGLPPGDTSVAALDVAGIGFLVVTSFVSAFTVSVLHALVAAGIGVLVFLWSLLTRVRRRLLAGAAIVLAGVVVAVALPLVELVPAWGGAGMWVLVALVGLLVVLAATFLERGRAAVRDGRTRFAEATAGWE